MGETETELKSSLDAMTALVVGMSFRIVVIPRVGKAARREERTRKAIAAGRKTFSQLRAERWMNATQEELAERYAFRNPGTRKSGMIGVESRR